MHSSAVEMKDSNGNSMEISGNYVLLSLEELTEIDDKIEEFQLKMLNLPIIKINVLPRNE